jgi:hypothetical protein
MPSPSIVSLGLLWLVGAADAEDRQFLKGNEEGAYANPRKLGSLEDLRKVCAALDRRPPDEDKNAYERGVERANKVIAQKKARREIYEVTFEGRGFRLGDYDVKAGELPLDLDKSLTGLDQTLTLSPLDKEAVRFKLAGPEAEDAAKRHQEKSLRLKLVFALADDRNVHDGGCYGHPLADAFTFLVYPLTWSLEKKAGEPAIASVKTERAGRLAEWLQPGAASLRIEVSRTAGTIDPAVLSAAVESKKPELEACVKPVVDSPIGSGLVSMQLAILPSGAFVKPSIELDSYEEATVAECVEKTLLAATVKKGSKASAAQVVVAVDR